jgi:hypothetical protein
MLGACDGQSHHLATLCTLSHNEVAGCGALGERMKCYCSISCRLVGLKRIGMKKDGCNIGTTHQRPLTRGLDTTRALNRNILQRGAVTCPHLTAALTGVAGAGRGLPPRAWRVGRQQGDSPRKTAARCGEFMSVLHFVP